MEREPDYRAVTTAELDAAVARRTRAALIGFLARHPDGPWSERVLRLLDEGAALPLSRPDAADMDADLHAAFDAAYRAGPPAAYDAFIARYAPHPLADVARRLQAR